MTKMATLCYVRSKGKTLMLHRNKKANDIHKGKYNGLGGKFESGETPEDCVIREVYEESGLKIEIPILKGFLTFPNFAKGEDWYVFVFVATEFSGEIIDCPEGDLAWIDDDKLLSLNLWEGDKKFIPWLSGKKMFSAKFNYVAGKLKSHSVEFY